MKWEVHADEYGNIYFSNCITGESVWELPEEEDEEGQEQVEEEIPNVNVVAIEEFSVNAVAVAVAESMVNIVDKIEERFITKTKVKRKFMSAEAEKRYLKNASKEDKKKKVFHDRVVNSYLNLLIPVEIEQTSEKRQVGTLLTADESRKWQKARENERDAKRRAIRRARKQHHEKVELLQRDQQMLILFRSDLTKYLLGKIHCSTELQKQQVLLLTTPQMQAEMLERKNEMRKKLEPEIAEKLAAQENITREKYEKNIRKVFKEIDEAGTGKLHLLQILFGVFSKPRPQKFAKRVRGLAELLGSTELQRFMIEFVSLYNKKDPANTRAITISEFREFVTIIEEVLDHYSGVKAAVNDAENDIEATLNSSVFSTGGASLARVRNGMTSAKKNNHELAMLREHEAQLQAFQEREKCRGFGSNADSLVMPKEEWEKNHHHRYIRLNDNLPLFCCLCRRRKWELWRRQHEEIESEFRSRWPTLLASRLKDEETRVAKKKDEENGITVEISKPANTSEKAASKSHAKDRRVEYEPKVLLGRVDRVSVAVRQTVMTLVMLVEATMSELPSEKSQRRVHKRKAAVSPIKPVRALSAVEVMERMKVFENEEQERKAMYSEELRMAIMLERNQRSVERPLLRGQDLAHDAYIRLFEHCCNPSGFLTRLDFERSKRFVPPHNMVLTMVDNGVVSKVKPNTNRVVLQTIPCRTEEMAEYIFMQTTAMQKSLRSPFVAEVSFVDKHMFQFFSEPGLLVECWPVVFVVVEYFHDGTWLAYYRRNFITTAVSYAAVERHLTSIFRQIASGLAAMHSLGLTHFNINLEDIYLQNKSECRDNNVHVKISGLLSWKKDFDQESLHRSDMHDCFNYNYAPPEVIKEQPITAKADCWMLGCALWEALNLWQQHQLILSTPNHPTQPTPPVLFHSKSVNELLSEVPIATSAGLRSLLRMLLQPNPAQRPQMNQVVDLLSLPVNDNKI